MALTWTTGVPQPDSRREHAAATDHQGRVYILGGATAGYLSSVARFDPATGAWTTVATLSVARRGLAAATDGQGRIYAIGGENGGGYHNRVDRYDPATGVRETLSGLEYATLGGAAATDAEGQVHFIGGRDTLYGVSRRIYRYNPDTGAWDLRRNIQNGRYRHAAATDGQGRIYIIGGYGSDPLASVERYDPATNTVTNVAPLPAPRAYHAAVTVQGRIYVMGGRVGSSSYSPSVVMYDPATDTWTEVEPLLAGRQNLGATVAPTGTGKIYALGGASISGNTVEVGTVNAPPNAPTLTTLADGSVVDVNATQRAAHTFSDPDVGDSQSAFDHRYRAIGAAEWTTAQVVSPNQWVDYPAGTFADGVDYERQVRTYDAIGAAGPWTTSGFFTGGSRPPAPTIIAPVNGATVGQVESVEWSAPSQAAYQLQVRDGDTVITDTGEVVSATARSRTLDFPDNGVARTIRARIKDAGLWSEWYEIAVTVSWTAPPEPTVTLTPDPDSGSLLVSIDNPEPGEDEPAASHNEVWINDGDSKGFVRKGNPVALNGMWRYRLPPSGREWVGSVMVLTVGTNGITRMTV